MRYQTPEDLRNEMEIMDEVATQLGYTVRQLSGNNYSTFDFAGEKQIGNRTLFAMFEVKSRTDGPYPTFMISLSKITAAMPLIEAGVHVYIVVRWRNGEIWYYRLDKNDKQHYNIRMGGRTVHTRPGDRVEPVVHIPKFLFTILR